MKQYLKLKLNQKLSPQQIQLMKLIQLPTIDFEQKIQQELAILKDNTLANCETTVQQSEKIYSMENKSKQNHGHKK